MKTSRGAYKLMKMFFDLADGKGRFKVDSVLEKRLKNEGWGVGRSFRHLRDGKYVIELGQDRFEMTDLARINLLQEVIKTRKVDGQLRIVMFDIPEKLKKHRNFFRQHLRDMGFRLQQQSIWVSPYPCEDLVKLVVKYHGLGKYVELAVGKMVAIR